MRHLDIDMAGAIGGCGRGVSDQVEEETAWSREGVEGGEGGAEGGDCGDGDGGHGVFSFSSRSCRPT